MNKSFILSAVLSSLLVVGCGDNSNDSNNASNEQMQQANSSNDKDQLDTMLDDSKKQLQDSLAKGKENVQKAIEEGKQEMAETMAESKEEISEAMSQGKEEISQAMTEGKEDISEAMEKGKDKINDFIKQNIVWHTGNVKYLPMEGGFYGIITDDGQKLLPTNLDKKYRQHNAQVKVKGKFVKIQTIEQWGKPFEISAIELIKAGESNEM